MVKNKPANAGDMGLTFGVRKIQWRRKQQPIPVFLPVKSQGQRSPVGYTVHGVARVRHDLAIKQQLIIYKNMIKKHSQSTFPVSPIIFSFDSHNKLGL